MSQRDGFAAGFLAGSLVGGVVGGVLGSLLASRIANQSTEAEAPMLNPNPPEVKADKDKKRKLQGPSEQRIEAARRSLEDKIAQLNQTIDEVRLSLGNVNGNVSPGRGDRTIEASSPPGSLPKDA